GVEEPRLARLLDDADRGLVGKYAVDADVARGYVRLEMAAAARRARVELEGRSDLRPVVFAGHESLELYLDDALGHRRVAHPDGIVSSHIVQDRDELMDGQRLRRLNALRSKLIPRIPENGYRAEVRYPAQQRKVHPAYEVVQQQ